MRASRRTVSPRERTCTGSRCAWQQRSGGRHAAREVRQQVCSERGQAAVAACAALAGSAAAHLRIGGGGVGDEGGRHLAVVAQASHCRKKGWDGLAEGRAGQRARPGFVGQPCCRAGDARLKAGEFPSTATAAPTSGQPRAAQLRCACHQLRCAGNQLRCRQPPSAAHPAWWGRSRSSGTHR